VARRAQRRGGHQSEPFVYLRHRFHHSGPRYRLMASF